MSRTYFHPGRSSGIIPGCINTTPAPMIRSTRLPLLAVTHSHGSPNWLPRSTHSYLSPAEASPPPGMSPMPYLLSTGSVSSTGLRNWPRSPVSSAYPLSNLALNLFPATRAIGGPPKRQPKIKHRQSGPCSSHRRSTSSFQARATTSRSRRES